MQTESSIEYTIETEQEVIAAAITQKILNALNI